MAKITIRVDPRTGMTYFPKGIRQEGFVGKIEGFPNALTFTLIKPGATLADVERSLGIILEDIALRRDQEANANQKMKDGGNPAKLPTRGHPLFAKYSRAWLSEVTGFSKSHLSRVATGRVPLRRSFIERVCFKLGEPEIELFLSDAARASPSPEGSEAGGQLEVENGE